MIEQLLAEILRELRLIRQAQQGESILSVADQHSLNELVRKSQQLADAVAPAVHKPR